MIETFDYDFYIEFYPDIANLSHEQALSHWQNFGKAEGRYGTAETMYLQNNIDINELPENFDHNTYFELNPDLKTKSRYRTIWHYLKWGKTENRLWYKNENKIAIEGTEITKQSHDFLNKSFLMQPSNMATLKYLVELSKDLPGSSLIWKKLSDVAFDLKYWQEALEALTNLSIIQGLRESDYYRLGEISENLDNIPEAFYFYLKYFTLKPQSQLISKLSLIASLFNSNANLTNKSLNLLIKALSIHRKDLYSVSETIAPYVTIELLMDFDGDRLDLLNLLPILLEKSENQKNWEIPLHILNTLEKAGSLCPLPDWIAVEIIWLQTQIDRLMAESFIAGPNRQPDSLVKFSIFEDWANTLKSMDCYQQANKLNNNFLLLDYTHLSKSPEWKNVSGLPITTLGEFLSFPEAEKTSPHVLFNSKWYALVEKKDSTKTPLLIHFFRHSSGYAKEFADPNPYFDCQWYQNNYLKNAKHLNPLLHYLDNNTQNNPHPLFDNNFVKKNQKLEDNDDPLAFYINQLETKGIDFCLTGFTASPFFNREYYLEKNTDLLIGIEKDRMDPFAHFLRYGKNEGRQSHPWQLYSDLVQHQLLHLEPFNKNSEFAAKNRLTHIKSDIAKNAYFSGQRNLASKMACSPLISLLLPIPQSIPPNYLQEMIGSVLWQTYENWQLCIAITQSISDSFEPICEFLKSISHQNPKIIFRINNKSEIGHGCNTYNSCLNLAQGEFVALLNHDDHLTQDALYEYVSAINKNNELDILYSDEGKVDEWGIFQEPYYKPSWSPHSLWSRMYIGHFTIVRKSLVEQIGGFRDGFDGFQDFDLLLRCCEQTNLIHHVPRVLCHTRFHEKPHPTNQAIDIGIGSKALNEALLRQGIEATIVPLDYSKPAFWVKPKIIGIPLVDIIIPSRNGAEFFAICLQSIFEKSTFQHFKITVIDNDSNESDFFTLMNYWLDKEPLRFQVIRHEAPFNYSLINNLGASTTNGDYLVFLNNDTEILAEDWLEGLLGYAQLPEVGAVGAKLYYPDDTIQHAGVVTGLGGMADHIMKHCKREEWGYFGNLKLVTNYSVVTGACMMVSREKFNSVHGFNEYLQVAFNDVDFCLKLRQQGLYNVYLPFVELYHYESKSRGAEDTPEKLERAERELVFMRQSWGKQLDDDPFYSPWLALNSAQMDYRYH